MIRQRYIIPGILSLISLYWIYTSITAYGFWNEGPRGGFMPLLAGLITLGFSLAAMLRTAGKELPWHRTVFIPVAIVLTLIGAVQIVGMLPALFLMLVGWTKGLERYSWKFSLILSACVIFMVWAVFKLWLSVPFPTGLLEY